MLLRATTAAASRGGLQAWRVVTWLLLLLAAFGCVQYVNHVGHVWQVLQDQPPGGGEAVASLHATLAWDIAYLLAALVLIVVCAGAILLQTWARVALQVAAAWLVLWTIFSGVILMLTWQSFSHAAARMPDSMYHLQLLQMHHAAQLALVLKAVGAVVLAWLAWRLGQPSIRAQFHGGKRR